MAISVRSPREPGGSRRLLVPRGTFFPAAGTPRPGRRRPATRGMRPPSGAPPAAPLGDRVFGEWPHARRDRGRPDLVAGGVVGDQGLDGRVHRHDLKDSDAALVPDVVAERAAT